MTYEIHEIAGRAFDPHNPPESGHLWWKRCTGCGGKVHRGRPAGKYHFGSPADRCPTRGPITAPPKPRRQDGNIAARPPGVNR